MFLSLLGSEPLREVELLYQNGERRITAWTQYLRQWAAAQRFANVTVRKREPEPFTPVEPRRVPMTHVPVFQGEKWECWSARALPSLKALPVKERLDRLIELIGYGPLEYLLDRVSRDRLTFDLAMEKLALRYGVQESLVEAQQLFYSLAQRASQSVQQFADVVVHVARRVFPDATEDARRDQSMRAVFAAGLTDERIKVQILSNPYQTWDEAVLLALKLERSLKIAGKPKPTPPVAPKVSFAPRFPPRSDIAAAKNPRVGHADQPAVFGQAMGKEGRGYQQPRPLSCWTCGRAGHTSRNCPDRGN